MKADAKAAAEVETAIQKMIPAYKARNLVDVTRCFASD